MAGDGAPRRGNGGDAIALDVSRARSTTYLAPIDDGPGVENDFASSTGSAAGGYAENPWAASEMALKSTGAGPFRLDTRIRTQLRAKRRHRAHGSLMTSGWSGGTSGDGSQRRLSSAPPPRPTHFPFRHASQPVVSHVGHVKLTCQHRCPIAAPLPALLPLSTVVCVVCPRAEMGRRRARQWRPRRRRIGIRRQLALIQTRRARLVACRRVGRVGPRRRSWLM